MSPTKIVFPLLILLIMVLACNLPGEDSPTLLPLGAYGNLDALDVEPSSGNGQFRAKLLYYEGAESIWVTCAYTLKDSATFIPVIIGTFQTEQGGGNKSLTMDFSETRPGQYLAYCESGGQELEQGFRVVSPYSGSYSCQDCFSSAWTDVTAIPQAPRRMGGNHISITINDDGLVTAANIYVEIFGTPPDYCVITRYVFEAVEASGAVNHETKELAVDFLKGVETYERSGGGQCEAPQVIVQPVMRFDFAFNDLGDLLLCSALRKGQDCLASLYAVLKKE